MCRRANPLAKGHEFKKIDIRGPVGVTIRNEYTVMQLPPDNDVYHVCGNIHVLDHRLKHAEEEFSLSRYAWKRGYAPVGRMSLHASANSFKAHDSDVKYWNIHPALPISDFVKGKSAFAYDPNEALYVDTKLRLLGLGHIIPPDMEKRLDDNKAEIVQHKKVIEQTCLANQQNDRPHIIEHALA